ncbi:MAG TPA: hypothetical protein DCW31_10360 [Lactobacillus sp.]|nr:hypothetical protein [Lactobacillus sp.]
MKNEKIGFGDVLIYSLLLILSMKVTGIIGGSWATIYNFSIFVLTYLFIYFVIDVIIKVITAAIEKRDE